MWRCDKKTISTLVLGALLAALLGLLLPGPSALAAGDDYPSAYKNQTNTTAADKWGFTQRQCVSFAAWRMEQKGHRISNGSQHWGSAHHWDDAAKSLGKKTTTTPKIGAIAQWNAYEASKYYTSSGATGTIKAGSQGHVAYVSRVYSDGSVQIEQYNLNVSRGYSYLRVKAPRYIYVY